MTRAFPDVDADDVVQTVILRLVSGRSRLAGAAIDAPWAYLRRAARNAALDSIRASRRGRHVDIEAVELPAEDAVPALLDRHATHGAVVAAFRSLIEEGDDATVAIITTWLDMADELGRAPSTREVAPRAGVSHTRVAQALKRFQSRVEPTS